MKMLAAAVVYFLIVFGTGFLVGPVRVYVEPRLGTTAAVLLEAPILLVAMAIGARIAVCGSQELQRAERGSLLSD
jgi:hypothetical protein